MLPGNAVHGEFDPDVIESIDLLILYDNPAFPLSLASKGDKSAYNDSGHPYAGGSAVSSTYIQNWNVTPISEKTEKITPQLPPMMIFHDSRSSAAVTASQITPCARISNFRSAKCIHIPCFRSNILLKYKNGGIIKPRIGNDIERIGIFARLFGKVGGDVPSDHFATKLDFRSNAKELTTEFEISVPL